MWHLTRHTATGLEQLVVLDRVQGETTWGGIRYLVANWMVDQR
ncbi:hypothetical protein Gorai_020990 [Gossypium raimondii]|uniref:Uncharacterized protein n=1 Tax=Gossypium raimondii TaxID=29730 RepID=A0A7J8NP70_GOSRA|nr:hypothetical protein [Gossypium raimondii]